MSKNSAFFSIFKCRRIGAGLGCLRYILSFESKINYFLLILYYSGCLKSAVSRARTVQKTLSSGLETKSAGTVIHYFSREMCPRSVSLSFLTPDIHIGCVPTFPFPEASPA